MTLKIYNSLTNQIEDFKPIKQNEVTMYNCGPTVYDYAHIGNFRAFVMADLLRRTLELNGYRVKQVMNITDVGHMTNDQSLSESGEDKMAAAMKKKLKKEGRKEGYKERAFESPWDVAKYYTKAFEEDFTALNLKKPAAFPHATDYIPTMLEIVADLVQKGFAYQAKDGAVYFDIQKFQEYGKLSNNTLDKLQSGAGGRVDAEQLQFKHNPHDFALWKQDESHLMKWESPFGTGYPGWHIECSAMSLKLLGETIDFHTGGEDNKFPHHECEIAQSEAYTGKHFVNYWVHTKFLIVDGEKMSKSKGNFYTIRDLTEKGYHPLAIRWVLMSTHFNQTLNFTLQGLDDAKKNIERLVALKEKLQAWIEKSGTTSKENVLLLCNEAKEKFQAALNDNLNASAAFAVALGFVTDINRLNELSSEQAGQCLEALKFFDSVLGVIFNYQVAAVDQDLAQHVETLIAQRQQAKQNKDYAAADAIRDQLLAEGIEIRDSKDGTTWKKR